MIFIFEKDQGCRIGFLNTSQLIGCLIKNGTTKIQGLENPRCFFLHKKSIDLHGDPKVLAYFVQDPLGLNGWN